MNDFSDSSKALEEMLARNEIKDVKRNWKIYPTIHGDNIKQRLIAAGVENAERWVEEGL